MSRADRFSSARDDAPDAQPDGRDETSTERLDRHWSEILQELRVVQTGTQILTGFLLALAFQPSFADLDAVQLTVYLTLVVLAALSTIFGLAPVSLHRALFRQQVRSRLVAFADIVVRATLGVASLLLVGVVFFVFDVVLSRSSALIAGGGVAVVVLILWFVVPALLRRGAASES